MKHYLTIATLAIITACTGHYKTPNTSGDPAQMSSDTLCFRYASSRDPKLDTEIDARGLDCTALLRDDPLLNRGRDLNSAYRIGR